MNWYNTLKILVAQEGSSDEKYILSIIERMSKLSDHKKIHSLVPLLNTYIDKTLNTSTVTPGCFGNIIDYAKIFRPHLNPNDPHSLNNKLSVLTFRFGLCKKHELV